MKAYLLALSVAAFPAAIFAQQADNAKQLQREQPDLIGRPFLDVLSAKVNDTFGASN
jgi:hypothetical protein